MLPGSCAQAGGESSARHASHVKSAHAKSAHAKSAHVKPTRREDAMIQEVFCQLRPYSAAKAIDFYKAAFGAIERFRLNEATTGRIGHAELQLGPAVLKL